MDRKIIGKTMKFLRSTTELKQEEVAGKAGISVSYYSLIENGKRSLSLETLGKVCNVFEVTPERFFAVYELIKNDNLLPLILEKTDLSKLEKHRTLQ